MVGEVCFGRRSVGRPCGSARWWWVWEVRWWEGQCKLSSTRRDALVRR